MVPRLFWGSLGKDAQFKDTMGRNLEQVTQGVTGCLLYIMY